MGSLPVGDPSEEEEKGVVVGRRRNGGGVPDLLEEAWFFRKLIDGSSSNDKPPPVTTRFMGRCFSDPTSSQSVVPPQPPPKGGAGLLRAPSLPPCVGRRNDISGEYAAPGARKSGGKKVSSSKSSKTGDPIMSSESKDKKGSKIKASGGGGRNPGSLARAPSLPPWIGREAEEEEESDGEENDMSMSRLIQQAMSSSLDDISTLPKHSASSSPKSMAMGNSRSMRNEMRGGRRRTISPDAGDHQERVVIRQTGGLITTTANSNPAPNPKGIRKLTKTMSNLEIQHDQATYYESKKATARPHRPSNFDHLLRCGGPPIPTWAGPTAGDAKTTTAATTNSSAEDIKAHLKVWARTVAANIH